MPGFAPTNKPLHGAAAYRLLAIAALVVFGIGGLPSCTRSTTPETQPDLAFANDRAARQYTEISELRDRPLPDVRLLSMGLNPASICESLGWAEATATAFNALDAEPASASTTATGRGCRTTVGTETGEIDVRLEIIDLAAVDDVVAVRRDLAEGESLSLMGFTELEFAAYETRLTSSLTHRELDRVEEHRWVTLDRTAFHLLVAIEPGSSVERAALLTTVVTLESAIGAVVAAHAASSATSTEADPAYGALVRVLQTLVQGVPLKGLATVQGREAIAFEYEHLRNIEGIAAYHDDAECLTHATGAVATCTIDAVGSVYHFTFVLDDDHWLLSGFYVEESDTH